MQTKLVLSILLLPVFLGNQIGNQAGDRAYTESTFVNFPSITNGPVLPTGGLLIDAAAIYTGQRKAASTTSEPSSRSRHLVPSACCTASTEADGSYPTVSLVRDAAGNLYGTSSLGGANAGCSCGTVFKLALDGDLTVLHSFTGRLRVPKCLNARLSRKSVRIRICDECERQHFQSHARRRVLRGLQLLFAE